MNFELDDAQLALRDTFVSMLSRYSTTEDVRAAYHSNGFDDALWNRLLDIGAPTLAVAEDNGGGGGTLLDLAIAAEQCGRFMAPTALVEAAVAARLAERMGANELLKSVVEGAILPTIAVTPIRIGVARMVPGGAVADVVLALDGEELVAIKGGAASRRRRETLGGEPVADWCTNVGVGTSRTVLLDGPLARRAWRRAVDEWKTLSSALLVGLAGGALDLTLRYTRDRHQFGAPIASFQTVAHRLADASTELQACRLLCFESAWIASHRPQVLPEHAALCFGLAAETASSIVKDGLHFHGGYGFMLEYDIHLYFSKAKARGLLLGDPQDQYRRAARLSLDSCKA